MKKEDLQGDMGKKLRQAREEVGLSQAQLAKELGYESATAVSLIEAGERKLSTEVMRKAAEVLHREVSYFLGQENPKLDVRIALRADKDLTEDDKKAVLHFIEMAKRRRHGK